MDTPAFQEKQKVWIKEIATTATVLSVALGHPYQYYVSFENNGTYDLQWYEEAELTTPPDPDEEIVRLKAEVERLTKALNPFAEIYRIYKMEPAEGDTDADLMGFMALGISVIPVRKLFEAAYKALHTTGEE